MDLQNITLFKMARKRMMHSAQRQTVIASNIANANTPDFLPSDIKPLSFKEELKKAGDVTLAAPRPMHIHEDISSATVQWQTSPLHQPSFLGTRTGFREDVNHYPYETSIDENGVNLEEQHLRLSNTRQMHDIAATLYKKYNGMIRMSLGGNLR